MWWAFLTLAAALNDTRLHVHLVPHTHDDVGWLKTVDQYYFGIKSNVTEAGVQYILDSVIGALELDPSRKFSYVEMGFFWRWWTEQSTATQAKVRQLVANGQLHFLNAGWSMHDEATPYFEDMIDNMAYGQAFLLKEFNYVPTVGWQIDPFGHSAANADLYAKMGLTSVFFARIDYQDFKKRLNEKALEMIWKPSTGTGGVSGVLAHTLYNHYSWPPGFCFDYVRCSDDPIADDPRLENYNADTKADEFVEFLFEQAEYYRSNHIMVLMGEDFNYQDAYSNFKNIDKIIDFVTKRHGDKVSLFYSTPSEYVNALNSANVTLPTKTDDFFPYADQPHAYWTGYFTSRPAFKKYVRDAGARVKAISNLFTHQWLSGELTDQNTTSNYLQQLDDYRQVMGVVQHHDGVSGTERQLVTFDYAQRMSSAIHEARMFYQMVSRAANNVTGETNFYGQCPLLNETICSFTERMTDNLAIAVFNPSYNNVTRLVEIPVTRGDLKIIREDNSTLIFDLVKNVYTPKETNNTYTLYFIDSFKPLEIKNYKLIPGPMTTNAFVNCTNCYISNMLYSLMANIDSPWKLIKKSSGFLADDSINLNITLKHYIGSIGDENSTQPSGAYIFRPQANVTALPQPYGQVTELYMLLGAVVDQVVAVYNESRAIQKFILKKGADDLYLGVQTWLNSIPIEDGNGKEIVVAYETDIVSDGTFYTDTNGMRTIRRQWNKRPTFTPYYYNEPQSSNYYPINSAIYYENNGKRITVSVDRAEGATAPLYNSTSWIEVMIHRRLLLDDYRGLSEPLNETEPSDPNIGLRVIVDHQFLYNTNSTDQRISQKVLTEPLQIFFANTKTAYFGQTKPYVTPSSIPNNYKVIMRPTSSKEVVVRVENFYGAGSFDLGTLLKNYGKNFTITELSLSENQPMASVVANQLVWNTSSSVPEEDYTDPADRCSHSMSAESVEDPRFTFNLNQVRTFKVTYS
eukprot:CAMPEP_0204897750 /NCGR_PEP_ID=MMETSP1397-20131031/896_1 /ASSEMBLY_ACC=CAM_ASM_000891 /TAXON_ID=49980 /ORGANISM="Climacostomum Climacostomum virens, Strain Stock W-24" /LENGTH=968 /DNA_ID=CAMNT_0052065525 /DNA_START=197 /DNA_END=3103 /DNA_ORIENTATION=+